MKKTRGMRMAFLAVVATLVVAGCTKKESDGTALTEEEQTALAGEVADEEKYTEGFYTAADSVLDKYLIFDADQVAERMLMGSEMASTELQKHKESAKELATEAAKLHRSCKALLKVRNTKALHDTMFENWQTFIASPNANLEDEDVLIHVIMGMAQVEYPNDSVRFYTENEELLSWRALHFWMVEKLSPEEVYIPDDHVKTVLFLMAARFELGKYDECIKTGEDFIEHLKQYSPQHEATGVIEQLIEEARRQKR